MPNPLETLTLRDLENWDRRDEAGNFLPSLAVLGHPVSHSVSPQMHNAALAHLVTQGHEKLKDWCYFKFDIEPDAHELEKVFRLLKQKNFQGLNLTVPLKGLAAMILLLKSNISATALSAVNTVVFTEEIKALNTDGFGMVEALKHDLKVSLDGRTVVILGAGGAATEVADECIRRKCATLWVGSRDLKKREEMEVRLIQYVHEEFKALPPIAPKVCSFNFTEPPIGEWPEDVIIINATTLGMKSDDPVPFDVKPLGDKACVMDMVYNRSGPTKLVAAAQARGLRATDGLSMLVWQGAKSLSIWLQSQAALAIQPEVLAPTMMTAACQALGLPPRHA